MKEIKRTTASLHNISKSVLQHNIVTSHTPLIRLMMGSIGQYILGDSPRLTRWQVLHNEKSTPLGVIPWRRSTQRTDVKQLSPRAPRWWIVCGLLLQLPRLQLTHGQSSRILRAFVSGKEYVCCLFLQRDHNGEMNKTNRLTTFMSYTTPWVYRKCFGLGQCTVCTKSWCYNRTSILYTVCHFPFVLPQYNPWKLFEYLIVLYFDY